MTKVESHVARRPQSRHLRRLLQRCNLRDTLSRDHAAMLHALETVDHTTRLLIVDDDPDIRELTAAFMTGHGYLVDVAEDGASMRAALARESYALVVLDVMMPGEDGLSILRSLDRATAPAVIILSVIGEEVDRIVGLEMGADDYIAKPANPRELLARVRSVLRRQAERPAARIVGQAPPPPAPSSDSPAGGSTRSRGSCSIPTTWSSTCPTASSGC